MFTRCPKCGHAPLPEVQAFPATCPACRVILARVGDAPAARRVLAREAAVAAEGPAPVDPMTWWARACLLVGLAVWGMVLARLDVSDGEIGGTFLHRPLLIFHEAGHWIFRPLGEWMGVFGGSFNQLLVPLVIMGAFLWKNRDPFGAAVALWLFGISLIDLAPYVYDALVPQLTLLSGGVGEESGHDWIWLLQSMHRLPQAQVYGRRLHAVGVLVVVGALGWGAATLARQWRGRATGA